MQSRIRYVFGIGAEGPPPAARAELRGIASPAGSCAKMRRARMAQRHARRRAESGGRPGPPPGPASRGSGGAQPPGRRGASPPPPGRRPPAPDGLRAAPGPRGGAAARGPAGGGRAAGPRRPPPPRPPPRAHTVAYRLALRIQGQRGSAAAGAKPQAVRTRPGTECHATTPGDLVIALEEELQRMSERHRLPLVLCYLEGKTNEQAAEVLGCPRGSMSARLAQARDRLRACLARRGYAVPAAGIATLLASAGAEASCRVPLLLGHRMYGLMVRQRGKRSSRASFPPGRSRWPKGPSGPCSCTN